jgi:ABC-type microcin C transport system duplicated ATPase subunit YejF
MTLLAVRDLTVRFGDHVVVGNVSFDLETGGRLGIIGESGSGKTMAMLAVLGVVPAGAEVTGSVRCDGIELVGASEEVRRSVRGRTIGMVFQEPLTALNPLMRVDRQIGWPLRLHHGMSRRDADAAAVQWCARVGLDEPERIARRLPHEMSGGQRQRIGLAIALAARPRLLIADEPTTALDVTVQDDILRLLDSLVNDDGLSLVFVSHDLAVVARMARDIAVMRSGHIVEKRPTAELFERAEDPYARALIESARRGTADLRRLLRGEA